MNAHQLAAFGEADVTEDELRTWLTSPSVEVERDIRVLEQDGRLVGYVDVDPNDADPPTLVVRPQGRARRRCGCDRGRARRLARGARRRRHGCACGRRRRTRGWSPRVERLGFAPARHSYRMEIDLADETRACLAGRDLGSHARRRRGATHLRGVHRGLAGHVRPTRRDLRGVGALADAGGDLRALAVVSRAERRRARRVLGLPAGHQRSSCGTRRAARRQATLAPAGARPRAAAARRSRRSGSEAGHAARSASTRRARPGRRGCTSGPGCASTGTRSFSSDPRTLGFERVAPPRPLPRLPDADRGRARAGVPVPLVRPRVRRRPRPRSAGLG